LDGPSSGGPSFRAGMQLRRLSGCYECHLVMVPVSGSASMRATICPWPDCGNVFVRQESLQLHQSIRHAVSELGTMGTNERAHDVMPVLTVEGCGGGLDEETERQQPRAMLAYQTIMRRVKWPKEEERVASVLEAAVVANVEGTKEYDSVVRLTRVNCRSDFIIWRSLFDVCCRLCKLFNC
jgi:hypothetical protein